MEKIVRKCRDRDTMPKGCAAYRKRRGGTKQKVTEC